ncbi:MAG: hypothetical protein L0331_05910 [Chloroflexi bacterium]|nr:hypothetical protein [Chloroflexota bacterium]
MSTTPLPPLPITLGLTENEARLIEVLRELRRRSQGRPFTVVVRDVDGRGLVQVFESVPVRLPAR